MSELVVFNMVSLDGFFEGPNHELDWHNTDDEFDAFAGEQIRETGTMLFGRVTYEMMAEYWPAASTEDSIITDAMNTKPKIVVSRTLDRADWNNTSVIGENIADEVASLKAESGKNPVLLGSADLMDSLAELNLIDEYRLMVNPVVLGAGTPLFKPGRHLDLTLADVRTFRNGNVLCSYRPSPSP